MKRGAPDIPAAAIAIAIHPFDDAPAPSRRLEKAVRKEARHFAKMTRCMGWEEASMRAEGFLLLYAEAAEQTGDRYHVQRWTKVADVAAADREGAEFVDEDGEIVALPADSPPTP